MSGKSRDVGLARRGRAWPGRLLIVSVIVLVPGAAALALARSAATEALQLRELRLEVQQLERQDAILSAPAVDDVLLALREDGDALRVRLLDAVTDFATWSGAGHVDYTIDAQPLGDDSALALRMLVNVDLSDGAALIELLGQLSRAATPWPAALRGCVVQRQIAGPLDVQCALDVLHWRDLEAPEPSHAG